MDVPLCTSGTMGKILLIYQTSVLPSCLIYATVYIGWWVALDTSYGSYGGRGARHGVECGRRGDGPVAGPGSSARLHGLAARVPWVAGERERGPAVRRGAPCGVLPGR